MELGQGYHRVQAEGHRWADTDWMKETVTNAQHSIFPSVENDAKCALEA